MNGARGFTLLEVIVVVAIVAVLSFLTSVNMLRQKERNTMRQEILELRAAIERTRVLAAQAGSRLGTPRLQLDNSCLPAASGDRTNLWVVFDPGVPGRARVPVRLGAPVNDVMPVTCNTFEVGIDQGVGGAPAASYRATFTRNIGTFAFGANGRLIGDGAAIPPEGFWGMVRHTDDQRVLGFRVLPSGITCDSADPAAAAPGRPLCEEDF